MPKHVVANNIKGKKVASKSKVGRRKPKRDNDSEGTPEGNKEDKEDNKDYEFHEKEAEDDFEAEDEDEFERGWLEAVVYGAIVDLSSNEEEDNNNDDPIMVMDSEQQGHTSNIKKRKQQPGERDNCARWRAPGHTVGVPRTSNQPTGHTVGGGTSVPTGHTVGRDAALSDHHLVDRIVQVRGMSKTESMRNRQKHIADRVRTFVKVSEFRRIKVINSDIMFQEAVPPHQRGQLQMLYESVFNKSLNTKRSSCERTGGKIVRESIAGLEGQ